MTRPSAEDRFIAEYLIDRDAFAAAQRAGIAPLAIKQLVKKFMRDPNVHAKIDAATLQMNPDEMISPQWVISKFQEVVSSPFSSYSTKTTALRELASMKGMYPDKNKAPDDGVRGGVVLVPATASLNDWEKAALKQQKALKEDVRS
jgi:hypothetical protein